jgi:hypothetical protein
MDPLHQQITATPTCLPAHLPTCRPAHLHTCPPAHLPTCPPAHLPTQNASPWWTILEFDQRPTTWPIVESRYLDLVKKHHPDRGGSVDTMAKINAARDAAKIDFAGDRMSFERLRNLHNSIIDAVPQLKRGQVWCHRCGHTQPVDSANALRRGWPKHCGETMSIDSPEERAAITRQR